MPKTKSQKRMEAEARHKERYQLLAQLGMTFSKLQFHRTMEQLRTMERLRKIAKRQP